MQAARLQLISMDLQLRTRRRRLARRRRRRRRRAMPFGLSTLRQHALRHRGGTARRNLLCLRARGYACM